MPKKPKPTPSGESGAPAALDAITAPHYSKSLGAAAALERWAAQEVLEGESVKTLTATLNNLLKLDRDDDEINTKIARAVRDLESAKDQWGTTSKILLSFEKGVPDEKRQGEKVLVEEAREIYRQLMLSVKLALEACIIADAQSAALCDAPEQFHKAHAENYRAAMDGAIESAKSDGVLPGWIIQ